MPEAINFVDGRRQQMQWFNFLFFSVKLIIQWLKRVFFKVHLAASGPATKDFDSPSRNLSRFILARTARAVGLGMSRN
jgi:hypothetical protein